MSKITKKPVKKVAAKKVAVKKVAVKKVAPKKVAVKKTAKAKLKEVMKKTGAKTHEQYKKLKPLTKKSNTGNEVLDLMLDKLNEAKKNGEKTIVVFTTAREHHNENIGSGISVNDLKPNYLAAYKHLFCNFDVSTKLISQSDKAVEWIVNLK